MAQIKQIMSRKITWAILIALLLVLPAFTLAGHRNDLYVDKSNSGSEDGSASHPYNTLKEALKKAGSKTDIHVANGTYKENIEIPDGVAIYGENMEKTIIEGKDDDEPVVTMENKTKINKVTVRKGQIGIEVSNNAKASIIKCVIKDNDSDGIRIKEGDVNNSRIVSISDSSIKNNDRAGIFSKKRRLSIINNDIRDNDKDGIALSQGVSAWMEDNTIKGNGGSGLAMVLDGASIWTKKNNIIGNKREGVEVNSYGLSGRIDLNKGKIQDNDRYGVARVVRSGNGSAMTSGFTIQSNVEISLNKLGGVSKVTWVK